MPKDKRPELRRVEKTIYSKVVINGKQRKGLLATTTVKYESSRDGVEGQWDSLFALASEPSTPIRQVLFAQLKEIEQHAQRIAQEEGYQRKSTLEVIKEVEKVAGVVVSERTYVAGNDSEKGSLLHSAYLIERQAKDVKDQIEVFESLNTRIEDRDLFYSAMSKALYISRQMMLITIQRHERAILRGSDSSFNHGAASKVQAEGVKRYEQIRQDDKKLSKTAAVNQVAKEYQRKKSTIFSWLKKFGK